MNRKGAPRHRHQPYMQGDILSHMKEHMKFCWMPAFKSQAFRKFSPFGSFHEEFN